MNAPFSSNTNFNDPDEFILDVCLKNGYDISKLSSKTRKREFVLPRQKCYSLCSIYAIKYNKSWSLNDIGSVLGYNHCMVLHAKKTIARLIETNNPSVNDIEDHSFRYWITKEDFIKHQNIYN